MRGLTVSDLAALYVFSIVLIIGLSVVLGLGYFYGEAYGRMDAYYKGYQDGYSEGVRKSFNSTPDITDITYPRTVYEVSTTGFYNIDGFDIHVNTSESKYLGNGTLGHAEGANDIYILTNRSTYEIYLTCVHEKLHHLAPDAPHRWVYATENSIADPTCLTLMTKLEPQ